MTTAVIINTTPFTFNVTLTPPNGYDLNDFSLSFPSGSSMTYDSGTKGYSGTIPVTDQTDVVIGNLPEAHGNLAPKQAVVQRWQIIRIEGRSCGNLLL